MCIVPDTKLCSIVIAQCISQSQVVVFFSSQRLSLYPIGCFSYAILVNLLQDPNTVKISQPAKKPTKVHIIDLKRSHNISIQLSGIKLPFEAIKSALLNMDEHVLSVEHLEMLSQAVPTSAEVEKLIAFPGEIGTLGLVERYFLEIIPIPRLEQRMKAFIFKQQFMTNINKVKEMFNASPKGANLFDVLMERFGVLTVCAWQPSQFAYTLSHCTLHNFGAPCTRSL